MDLNEKDYLKLSKTLSEEEIQNYLFGELTESEKHKIELLLLDNSAESDSVDGLSSIKNKDVLNKDLSEIQKRIRDRISKGGHLIEVKPIKVWRYNPLNIAVAATVSVLLVVCMTIFFFKMDYFGKKDNLNTLKSNSVPVGGLGELKNYIDQNIICPSQAKEKNINSSVYLNFVINKDGLLSDFKIIKGIGYGCDEEAIRLIKNGPKWRPAKIGDKPVISDFSLKVDFHCIN